MCSETDFTQEKVKVCGWLFLKYHKPLIVGYISEIAQAALIVDGYF